MASSWPASMSLPPRNASTSQTLAVLSLRIVKSSSFASITTGTLNVFFVMPGLTGLTSVGDGTASSRANRVSSESSRGTLASNSLLGNRAKYGRPYATNVNTPAGENWYASSISSRALASSSWSSRLGADISVAVAKSVKTGGNATMTLLIVIAGAVNAPMSNCVSGRSSR